jgi:hypothetical protein
MNARKLLLLTLVVALVAVTANTMLRRKVDLVLVNPSPTAVSVTVDGAPYVVPAAGKLLVEGVSPDLKLAAAGVPVSPGVSGAASAKTFVWSVAPVTTWWTVSKGYGDQVGKSPATTAFVPSSSPVFALPDDYLALVDAPLPENAAVKKGVTGTVLRGLWSDGYARRTTPPQVMLVVHNDSTAPLRVELDGVVAATLPPNAVMHVPKQAAGPVKLRAVTEVDGKDGKEYSLSVTLTPAPPQAPAAVYVWDVTGTSHFWVASRRYGVNPDADGPPPPPEQFVVPAGFDSTFFRLPEGYFHEVDATYPDKWHRQELLKFLWCEKFLQKEIPMEIPASLQRQLAEDLKQGKGQVQPVGSPEDDGTPPGETTTEPAFPPVSEDERKGE